MQSTPAKHHAKNFGPSTILLYRLSQTVVSNRIDSRKVEEKPKNIRQEKTKFEKFKRGNPREEQSKEKRR